MLKQAGHRMALSPWFAAGAGVVIATGVLIYAPHANLNFGGAIQVGHCSQALCGRAVPEGGASPMPVGPVNSPAPSPHVTNALAGMTFSYQVVERNQFGFILLITIKAQHSLGNWSLSFVIPDATAVYVVAGAHWTQSGSDGGTASNYLAGTESVGYTSISGNLDGIDGGPVISGNTVQLTVYGTGTPRAPQGRYDNLPCLFTGSLAPAPTGSPSPG
jgi:hypothetical protein